MMIRNQPTSEAAQQIERRKNTEGRSLTVVIGTNWKEKPHNSLRQER